MEGSESLLQTIIWETNNESQNWGQTPHPIDFLITYERYESKVKV